MDFEVCTIIYPDIDSFQISFQIYWTVGQLVARKVTFREKITFTSKKTVYICVDYMSFSKGRFFIMTTIYLAVSNIIIDSTTLRIAIFVNPTDKPLKICKSIYLGIIHEFVKTIYFLIDVFKVVIILAVATTTLTEPLL